MVVAELLDALAAPRARTIGELAEALGTDVRRLRLAVDHCRQLGYLESSDPRCEASSCGGCRLPCGLRTGRARDDAWPVPVSWRLTVRGRDAVARSRGRGPADGVRVGADVRGPA